MKAIINLRWPIIRLILLLFFGKLICQAHLLVYMFWPGTAEIKLDLFIGHTYEGRLIRFLIFKDYNAFLFDDGQNITVLYYLYELTGILRQVIWNYVFLQLALYVSWKLSKAAMVFFACEIIQALFYMWNRNTSFWADNIVYVFMAAILIIIFLPDKPTAKYIEMQSK